MGRARGNSPSGPGDPFSSVLGHARGSAAAQAKRDRDELEADTARAWERARTRRACAAVSRACETAAVEHREASVYLRDLARSFSEQEARMDGAGPILRLERWWDEAPDGGALTSVRGTLRDAREVAPDGDELEVVLAARGFYDGSDASQPMAQMFIVIKDV